jgi:hypothetical protein
VVPNQLPWTLVLEKWSSLLPRLLLVPKTEIQGDPLDVIVLKHPPAAYAHLRLRQQPARDGIGDLMGPPSHQAGDIAK